MLSTAGNRPFTMLNADRGAGDREKRGREVYGRREKRGREAGEKGKNYATSCNISQSKKCKGAGAVKYRAGPGLKGTGSGRFKPPCPPQLWYYSSRWERGGWISSQPRNATTHPPTNTFPCVSALAHFLRNKKGNTD